MKARLTAARAHLLLTLLLCAAVGYLGMSQHLRSKSVEETPFSDTVTVLAEAQEQLRETVGQLASADFVPQAAHQSDLQALSEQIEGLKLPSDQHPELQAVRTDLSLLDSTFATLKRELADLKAHLDRHAAPSPAKAARKAVTPPKRLTPPFDALGIEQRGEETLLVIAPPHNHKLANLQLLRIGDRREGWKLQAIEGNDAHFQSPAGDRQIIAVR